MNSPLRNDNDPSSFRQRTPHFFKIILGDTIRNRKLMIPPRFTRKYGRGLPSQVLLSVPTGATWRVELVRCGGEIWLQNGWKEFADYYSVTYGHLLLFQYKGNHDLHVRIFDTSATEIEYPLGSLNHDEQPGHDASVQDLEMEESEPDTSVQDLEVEESEPDTSVEIIEERMFSDRSDAGSMPKKPESARRMQPMFGVEKAKALCRASAFKSTNPFFKIVIQPSFVLNEYNLCVPAGFAKEHFTQKSGDVILSLSGRTWHANYYFNVGVEGNTTARIFGGWREFVQNNSLRVGDVCVFELVHKRLMVFRLAIFRLDEDGDSPCLPAGE
ncbi:hypothetical protein Tsubulata_009865 [Turnera subulata]|uniref:TF-B3 domain-containing protein n=1 Tax=Turnera subulata TaxID=218843 RepID=A0A9Q0G6T6_9ROSI|nr:hypothetical protein Tsubulata_009865 [Turnera subulata]